MQLPGGFFVAVFCYLHAFAECSYTQSSYWFFGNEKYHLK